MKQLIPLYKLKSGVDILSESTSTIDDASTSIIDSSVLDYNLAILNNGLYRLAVGAASNKVIETAGSDISNNAKVDIWSYGNVPAQKFYIEYVNGYYKITARHSGKSLTVKDSNLTEGAAIVQAEYEGLDSQKWIIRDSNINGLVISLLSNPELSISIEGDIVNGSNLILSKTEYNNNQMLYFFSEKESERTVKDGAYRLAVGAASNKVMEVKGSNTADGAELDIWNYVNATAQKFNIEYNEEGYYKITARHTGKSLTVKDNNLTEGAEIVQATYEGLDSQKWVIRDSKVNGLVISLLENPTLSITINGKIVNGAKLTLSKNKDNNNQMFYFLTESANEQTVKDGVYKILVGSASDKGLEVTGSNKNDGAKVGIWSYGNATAQKFNIEYNEQGYYKITARHTGKSLTVKDNNLTEGAEIVQATYEGLESQKWIIRDSKVNGLVISLLTNPTLSITIAGNIENGNKLILADTKNNDNQMLYFYNENSTERTAQNGIFKLAVGANSNKIVEIKGSNTADDAEVDIWDYGNAAAQKFNIEYINGYYKITAKHTGKSLTVKDGNLTEGAEIVQATYKGLDSQKWIIRDSRVNGLVISLLSNPELSITIKGDIANGANLILAKTENTNNQMFYFIKAQIAIVLNAGHGGSSTGCANGGIVEKNVTLYLARKIRDNLNRYSNVEVILSRDGDYDMDLAERAMVARDNHADLYISLHINDESSHTSTGSQMYVPFYEGTKQYNSNMTRLANLIQANLNAIGITNNISGGIVKRNIDQLPKYQYLMNGQVVQADYYADIRHAMKGDTLDYGLDLNTNTGVPAILVEHCFMNSSDVRFLDSNEDLDRLANADTQAIIDYFNL